MKDVPANVNDVTKSKHTPIIIKKIDPKKFTANLKISISYSVTPQYKGNHITCFGLGQVSDFGRVARKSYPSSLSAWSFSIEFHLLTYYPQPIFDTALGETLSLMAEVVTPATSFMSVFKQYPRTQIP